jgi:hypothetical protein
MLVFTILLHFVENMKIPFELELIGSKHCLLQDLKSPPLKGLAPALASG